MGRSEFDANAEQVLFKCGRHCCICRRFRPTLLQVHHIVERNDGGGDEIDNLIPVCLTCHSDAHTERQFARRFSVEELKQHRDRVYDMVAKGILIPPNDDVLPIDPAAPPLAPGPLESFVITEQGLIQPALPTEAIEILLAAAESDGQVIVVKTRSGYAVQVNRRNLVPDRKNPRDEARYENGIGSLLAHGFLTGSGQVRRVTHQGFLLADALSAVKRHR